MNSDPKFDPDWDLTLVENLTQGSVETGSHFDKNSDLEFDPKRDLILIKILTPRFVQKGISF